MGVALFSLVGILIAAYLYLYKIGVVGTLACGTGGCETVQLSRWARFLGVEVSLIGLLGYLGLFVVALVGLQPGMVGRRSVSVLLVAMSGAGLAFAGYLTVLELFVIHAICRWCVASAAVISLVFALALLDLDRGRRRTADSLPSHPA